MKFMYDVVNKETGNMVREGCTQELVNTGMSVDEMINAVKFFCAGAEEEVINVIAVEE